MKVALSFALSLLLSGFALAEEPRISVRAMLAEVPADMKIPADPTQLGQQKGVDFVALPAMTTGPGEPAKFKIARDFGEPGETPQVGFKLSVIPKLEGGKIHFVADFDYTEFSGFADGGKDKKTPMFDVRQALGMKGDAEYGKAVVMTAMTRANRQMVQEVGKPDRLEISQKNILVILIFEKAE
jgi:hypothetical protein